MKSLIMPVMFVFLLSTLASCVVRTRGHGHRHSHRRASCPPAHHWDGYSCVKNGRGPKVRDHRRGRR